MGGARGWLGEGSATQVLRPAALAGWSVALHTPFIHLFIHSFIWSFIYSFIRSFIRSFVHSFIRSFIYSLIRSFICSFTHSFLPSFMPILWGGDVHTGALFLWSPLQQSVCSKSTPSQGTCVRLCACTETAVQHPPECISRASILA